jgi:hypothetical protein
LTLQALVLQLRQLPHRAHVHMLHRRFWVAGRRGSKRSMVRSSPQVHGYVLQAAARNMGRRQRRHIASASSPKTLHVHMSEAQNVSLIFAPERFRTAPSAVCHKYKNGTLYNPTGRVSYALWHANCAADSALAGHVLCLESHENTE